MRISEEVQNPIISYITDTYTEEDELLVKIKNSIEENNLRKINISAYEGKILQVLLKLTGAKKIVEVGTLAGYSTVWMAMALPDEGFLYSFEKDEIAAKVAIKNLKGSHIEGKIKIIIGDAHENLKHIENEAPFDAIFIDAEKTGYEKYLDWADKNLKKGGLIIADNTLFDGKILQQNFENKREEKTINAIKNFNLRLAEKQKYNSIILPTNQGLSVAIKLF